MSKNDSIALSPSQKWFRELDCRTIQLLFVFKMCLIKESNELTIHYVYISLKKDSLTLILCVNDTRAQIKLHYCLL